MKRLYFDLMGGISGDMSVAALLDIGVSFNVLKSELLKIRLKNYSLKKSYVQRGHIKAAKFDCHTRLEKNYSYDQIMTLITHSKLSAKVKEDFKKVYGALRDAEVVVHGHRHGHIHFHQLGEIDSIIDIASVCICLNVLGVDQILFGVIPVGHKVSPAAFNLLEGKDVYFTGEMFENITPTGMAILTALGRQAGTRSSGSYKIGHCGYGAGAYDAPHMTNTLRIAELKEDRFDDDEIYVIETNIDDMNPQFFESAFEKLFEAGALDVYVTSLHMKKARPGFLLTVLSKPEKLGMITSLVLTHTSSVGVRYYPVRRLKLAREIKHVVYKGVKIRVKYIRLPGGDFRAAPEYDDCKRLAKKLNIPIAKIYDEIKKDG